VRAVLSDLDGTLADSGEFHWRAWRDTMAAAGEPITHDQFLASFGQRNDAILTKWLGDRAEARRCREIGDAKEALYRRLIQTEGIAPLPGAAEWVARLQDLGATPAQVGQGDVPWTVLADPEGNEFCVLEPREIYRDTGPIAAVVVDCADPRAMARFWGEAIDWTLHEVTDDRAVWRSAKGVGPYLEFLRTPGGKTVPDRTHLDLLPYPGDDKAAEVARLRALGATDLDLGQGDVPWTCLVDPEGHEFCVLALS